MRRWLSIVAVVMFLGLSVAPAYPYWIWTPKTGKWVNPKRQVKPTPKEQFNFAKGFYDKKKYEEAKTQFKQVLKAYPKSFEASESQYYLGLIEEAQGNLYEGYLAFQKVIDKYPFSERIQEIIEREYKIGQAFMSGAKRKALGMSLPVENPAVEIFAKVVENSTYGPLASAAQYKLGLVLKGLLRYYEAEDAFNKVLSNYPNSEWTQAAEFQLASCRAAVSRGSDYDQGATQEAKQQFEDFVKEHPEAGLSRDAEKNVNQLGEKEAQAGYNTGRFYEKQKAYGSARIYYNDTINRYADSAWAAKALERLQIMEKRK